MQGDELLQATNNNDIIKQNLADYEMIDGKNIIPNSFLDLLGGKHNMKFKKISTKSLAYDSIKLKKMRALYGRRGTFNFQLNKDSELNKDVKVGN